jgi:helicase
LATEKYEEYNELFKDFPVKIAISTGDYDSKESKLRDFDLILITSEKLDSVLRHSPEWINEIGLLVIDEIHLLDSPRRGPTLEVITSQLKDKCTILALSATIENSDELAKWLNADLIDSDFRPVKLSQGVYLKGEVSFKDKDELKLVPNNEPPIVLARNTVKNKGQSLIFVNTRRGAESEAERNSLEIYKLLNTKEKKFLSKLANQVLHVLDSPTKQCKRLSDCIRKGTAFHHAGLHGKQRKLIEENFKQNLVKVICATPTLAWGVNLPSKRVIIRDYKRYGSLGMEPIPILEIHQMFGRAGRPKYDTEGEAILIAKSLPELENLWDHYIEGTPEPITSKLGVEPILRMHTIGLVAQNPVTKEQLLEFFERTFYAYQYGNLEGIEKMLNSILDQLFEWKFIDYDAKHKFKCTQLGMKIAQLYIDPLTAYNLIELMDKKIPDDLVLLTILSDTAEMRPLASVRRSEEIEIYENFAKHDLEDEQIRAFKNAYLFFEWMNEITDDKIYDKYNIPPGTLRTKLEIADWLLYSCSEIARILQRVKIIPKTNVLRKRLKYGVKMELLPLVRVRNIGRVRARNLFKAGIKNIKDIKKAKPEKLEKLIGKKITGKVLGQLE